jgi:hypothetical protein
MRAKMRNPTQIAMRIENYSLDLRDQNSKLIATGIQVDKFVYNTYDPDLEVVNYGIRRSLLSSYYNNTPAIDLNDNNWHDILFAFNFSAYEMPEILGYKPDTKENLLWFINSLFSQSSLTNLKLSGDMTVIIGERLGGEVFGITAQLGNHDRSKPKFVINNVNFHQSNYKAYNGKDPINLMSYLHVGEMNISAIDVNKNTQDVIFDLDCTLNFTNPYRYSFN